MTLLTASMNSSLQKSIFFLARQTTGDVCQKEKKELHALADNLHTKIKESYAK